MALAAVDYHIFESLRKCGLLPARASVLELGESQWYGDLSLQALAELIDSVVSEPARRQALQQRLRQVIESESPHSPWDLAKIFYAAYLDLREIVAIDFHGTSAARKIDLNYPVDLGQRFDMVIDSGTAEHVFNVFQFFKTCHDHTRAGGLMLHNNPFRGWLEHGFYNFNPTFYWDLASANRYDVVMLVYNETDPARLVQLPTREKIVEMARARELGVSAMLYAVYRKPQVEAPFVVPGQACYTGALSEEMAHAWRELR